MKELIRDVREKKVVRMLKIVIENNTETLELQKMLMILIKNKEE